jgi:hypothetical protein
MCTYSSLRWSLALVFFGSKRWPGDHARDLSSMPASAAGAASSKFPGPKDGMIIDTPAAAAAVGDGTSGHEHGRGHWLSGGRALANSSVALNRCAWYGFQVERVKAMPARSGPSARVKRLTM